MAGSDCRDIRRAHGASVDKALSLALDVQPLVGAQRKTAAR
ncbi:MAG: hypothetical protein ACI8W3_001459, partial [Myxococcota bacterium]